MLKYRDDWVKSWNRGQSGRPMGSPPSPGVGLLSAKAVIRPEGLWGVSRPSLGAPQLPHFGWCDPTRSSPASPPPVV